MSRNRTVPSRPAQSLRSAIVALTCLMLSLGGAGAQDTPTVPSRINSSGTHSATSGSYVNYRAVDAAVGRAVAAVINPSLTPVDDAGWTAGYLPVFDASGNLQNSYLNQVINTATTPPTVYLGFNTPTPSFNLHFTTTVDPAAFTIDAYGDVGINFIGRRADGTLANPTAVQAGDNLFTLNGRGWFTSGTAGVPSGFSASSRANVKIFAAEPAGWTDKAEGTYITMATTQIGSVNTTEKMRITDAGNVGIGTTTPAHPLTVNGIIQSTTGGIMFPDGSSQTTAQLVGPQGPMGATGATGATGPQGPAGAAVTSPNESITVGVTPSGQTVEVNTAVIQQRVTGTCAVGQAVAAVNANGTVTCIATGLVTDAKGNPLGRLLSMNGTDLTIDDKGYIITVGITGQFPVGYTQAPAPSPQQLLDLPLRTQQGILWTGSSCNGTGYLDAGYSAEIFGSSFPTIYTKTVVYSAQTNSLMVPEGSGTVATAINISDGSEEFAGYYSGTQSYVYADGVSFCYEFGRTEPGWPLVAINPATTLGWTVSGNPLSLAGPLQFQ